MVEEKISNRLKTVQIDRLVQRRIIVSIKENAIVLGGTSAHIELINRLKERGYRTILVDYYKNPIAKPYADEHIQASTLDKDIVLDIAKEKCAKLVISSSVDQANVTAVFVSQKLGLYVPYDYNTALNVSNKVLMKRIMMQNNIPTAKFIVVDNEMQDFANDLCYPVIVKPSDSNGSKGVQIANDKRETLEYVQQAMNLSRDQRAIVEEFVDGREIGIDCIVKNGEVEVVMSRERRKIGNNDSTIQQIYGSIWPAQIGKENLEKLRKIVKQICKAFKLDNTPIIVQAIMQGNEFSIIEFAPRIGGGENSRIIRLSTGFDIIEASICSYLGEIIRVDIQPNEYIYSDNLIYTRAAIYAGISDYQKLIDDGTIDYLIELKTKGMEVGELLSSNNRVGAFVAKAPTVNELYRKMRKAYNELEVYDISGQQIMRKDLYKSI